MKRFVDLSRTYYPDMPEAEGHRNFEIDSYRNAKSGANLSYLKFTSHTGTHIDAPSHFIDHGKTIDRFGVNDFTGPGFVIDLHKTEDEAITLAEIERYDEAFEGIKFLFIRTGWERAWGRSEYVKVHPYLDPAAAKHLVGRVKFLGIDALSPEATFSSGKRKGSPVHEILLSNDVLIIENLCNLDKVKNEKFQVFAFPMNVEGSDGAPVRVVAEIDEEEE